jgi:glycine cleavage system regulatory protein
MVNVAVRAGKVLHAVKLDLIVSARLVIHGILNAFLVQVQVTVATMERSLQQPPIKNLSILQAQIRAAAIPSFLEEFLVRTQLQPNIGTAVRLPAVGLEEVLSLLL